MTVDTLASERLAWLEDKLRNGWTLICDRHEPMRFAIWAPGRGEPTFEAPTLCEAIDKAARAKERS